MQQSNLIRRLQQLVFAAAMSVTVTGAAHATAMVNVRGYWDAGLWGYTDPSTGEQIGGNPRLPNGFTLTCQNYAGPEMCMGSAQILASNDSAVVEDFSTVQSSGFTITNTTDTAYDMFFFTDFSSFNPGGPAIGASVTNPSAEYALFSSTITGPSAFDTHGCDTRLYPGHPSGGYFSAYACGVPSPDSSMGLIGFDIAPHDTVGFYYTISINAELKGVPEPAPLFVFAAGLAGLVLLRVVASRKRTAG